MNTKYICGINDLIINSNYFQNDLFAQFFNKSKP